jgi:hypothetical protein
MKVRKKPVVEAILCRTWLEAIQSSVWEGIPAWASSPATLRIVLESKEGILLPTPEGDMLARPEDYVICGIKGELYPCRPDIFEATYEVVDKEVES